MKIFVHQVVGDHCLTVADGRRLYKHFIPELQAAREVELDFSGVCVIGSPFFNSSLDFLLRDFEMEELRRLVKVSNLDSQAQAVLKRVVKNCNLYYRSTPP
ncbi:MAG: STAS-like domain-containing protein [Syntrophobacterales bacterium]|jgi:hypothetical protein|nr:STAS-like domain-containing protein [Syntrophobacterales bacterium]